MLIFEVDGVAKIFNYMTWSYETERFRDSETIIVKFFSLTIINLSSSRSHAASGVISIYNSARV